MYEFTSRAVCESAGGSGVRRDASFYFQSVCAELILPVCSHLNGIELVRRQSRGCCCRGRIASTGAHLSSAALGAQYGANALAARSDGHAQLMSVVNEDISSIDTFD